MLLLGYGWWAVALRPFSGAATAAVLLAGGGAALVGTRLSPRRWPQADLRRASAWAVLVAVAGLWQLAAYLQHPRDDHPTLSSLANALLDSQPARAVAFVLWAMAAVGLSRR